MNVLLLSQFFSTTRGGGEYVFNIMAKKLAENNHKVWVIMNKISGERYLSHENIKLITVSPTLQYEGMLPPRFSDNLRYSFNAVIKGMKIIRKEKIDIIHSNNFAPALAGSTLSYFTSKPHITTVHDIFTLCGKDYWKRWGSQSNISRLSVTLAPFFEKLMIRLKHNCIHTVSDATKDDLIKFGEKKPIYVINNAIEDSTSSATDVNQFQFVCVGRIVFYKNLEVVLKAISLAKKSEPKIKLIIVGDGPHRIVIEDLVNELNLKSNIEFIGYVTKQEKIKLISQSNALLFPSLCEGFGLVILEAFSQRKPVLVSNVRPSSDIISHGVTGFVLDPNDEKGWSKHILELTHNLQESQRMGKNGFELLEKKYNQDVMYQKISKMYEDVINKRVDRNNL